MTTPVYFETVQWRAAASPPPLAHDVLVTFTGTRGAYIAAYMGPADGWIGVDGLPLDDVSCWAEIPPGPPLALQHELKAAAAQAQHQQGSEKPQPKWDTIPAGFNAWWDSFTPPQSNPFTTGTPAYWAWEGWKAHYWSWEGWKARTVNTGDSK